jgi:16S rRNA processing protein RimM
MVAEVLTDAPGRFDDLRRVFIENPGGDPQPAVLADVWWHQGRLILRLAGVDSIDQADALRGRLVLVPRQERAALGRHRYYVSEIIGCVVLDRRGSLIGEVVGVEPTGGVDLLKVRRAAQADAKSDESDEVLIPLAQEICSEIDVEARRIVIEPPEGLLEAND